MEFNGTVFIEAPEFGIDAMIEAKVLVTKISIDGRMQNVVGTCEPVKVHDVSDPAFIDSPDIFVAADCLIMEMPEERIIAAVRRTLGH